MIKVSVIIPTYKPNDYLFECINSVLKQTLDNSLYEIIIVLNGPKSPYYEQIQNVICEVDRIETKLLYSEENGVSLARNIGLDIAEGEYFAFIDDDDLVSSNYLESLLSICKPKSVMCSNVKTFVDDVNHSDNDYLGRAFKKNKQNCRSNIVFCRSFLSSACAKLIPKDVIRDRRFNPAFNVGEDALFVALISDRIKRVELSSEDTIYFRRLRDGSASRKKRNFIFELKNPLTLMFAYFKIYFKSPFQYNLLFFTTRELAVIKSFIYRIKV